MNWESFVLGYAAASAVGGLIQLIDLLYYRRKIRKVLREAERLQYRWTHPEEF